MEPKVDPPARDPTEAYDALLAKVVTADGLVNYDVLEADRAPLDDYVAWLARPKGPSRENPQHAFWINAYNALVLYAVLEDARPASVKDIEGIVPVGGAGFFLERTFVVHGRAISLFEIEHERLRGRLMDVRDHGALNCASMGCPPLRPAVYRRQNLDAQLREQMTTWVSDLERGVRVEDGRVVFSPIFEWYAHDFAFFTGDANLCVTAARYAVGPKAKRLRTLGAQGCPHTFGAYDWSLNDASQRSR